MPARPYALESVCRTTQRGCAATRVSADGISEKSEYASSTTTMPPYRSDSSSATTTSFGMSLAVGLPGLHSHTIFVLGVTASSSAGRSTSNSGVSGALMTSTSFTAAHTLYMPYVGGVVRMASAPGVQKARMSRSMASSLPTPTNRFSGRRPAPRCAHTACLRWSWYLREGEAGEWLAE